MQESWSYDQDPSTAACARISRSRLARSSSLCFDNFSAMRIQCAHKHMDVQQHHFIAGTIAHALQAYIMPHPLHDAFAHSSFKTSHSRRTEADADKPASI